MDLARWIFAACVTLALASCGGGGGTDPVTGLPNPGGSSGDFSLSQSTVELRAPDNGRAAKPVDVRVHVSGSRVARVVAGFPQGGEVGWLFFGITGSGNDFTVQFSSFDPNVVISTRTATVVIQTRDANNEVLSSRNVKVTYEIFPSLRFASNSVQRNYLYGATVQDVVNLDVVAPGKTWRVTADAPWAHVPAGNSIGSGALPVTVDVAAIGSFNSVVVHLTMTNVNDSADTDFVNFSVQTQSPGFSVAPSITLGGVGGEEPLTATVPISLNTGANGYPWRVELLNLAIADKVSMPVTQGTTNSANPPTFTISLDEATIATGSYAGTLRFTATVLNETYRRDVPLLVNREEHRLVPLYDGVAFSSFPGRAMLTRKVRIDDSRGRAGIPFTAVSSQPWLSVAPAAAVTGDEITLTVAPGTLSADAFSEAAVTLASTSAIVARNESVRVGVWKGSVDPPPVSVVLPYRVIDMMMNPVEPWVYLLSDDGTIHIFNVHTGTLVRDLPSHATAPVGTMTISSNGRRLFVTDGGGQRTVELDANNGVFASSYAVPSDSFAASVLDKRARYSRIAGHPVLFPAFSGSREETAVVDLESRLPLPRYDSDFSHRSINSPEAEQYVSPDGKWLYSGFSNSLNVELHTFSLLHGAPSIRLLPFEAGILDYQSVCVTPDNRFYASTSSGLRILGPNLRGSAGEIAISPYSISCAWDGRVFATVSTQGDPNAPNVAIYDGTTRVGGYRHPQVDFGDEFQLSGDLTRLVWPEYMPNNSHRLVISSVP